MNPPPSKPIATKPKDSNITQPRRMDALPERVGTFYFLIPQIDPVNKYAPVTLVGVPVRIPGAGSGDF